MIKTQKGTRDILFPEILNWQKMEAAAQEVFGSANFEEIRTPIFEATELFSRGVGETTDIVNKEMYTFEKSDRSITLRPENTAGVVRSFIENGMHKKPVPVKLWYHGPMFRYERPQAGRQRQFHQVGVEMFGVKEPMADVEVISLAVQFLNKLGLNDLEVEINSLGCASCRTEYKKALKAAIAPVLNKLCPDCQSRYEKNPLRILDCKVEDCIKELSAPEIQKVINSDFICEECSSHFEKVKELLSALNIKYSVNKQLVRGLDYYNRTVFEIKSNNLGSQNTVCGGGRYDGLVEMLGGAPTPAVGWAMGMERLNSLLPQSEPNKIDYYIISDNQVEAVKLAQILRVKNKTVEFDYQGKKFGKQFEKAGKIAKFALILGEEEIKNNEISIKNMETGEQKKVKRKDFIEG